MSGLERAGLLKYMVEFLWSAVTHDADVEALGELVTNMDVTAEECENVGLYDLACELREMGVE